MRKPVCVVVGLAVVACLLEGCGGGGGDNKGILSFTSLDFSEDEQGNPVVQVTVQRLGGDGEVGATIVLTDGTATAADYDATPIVVTWPAGDVSEKTVTIPIFQDHDDEPDETVIMTLTHPTGGATIRHPLDQSTLTIVDDDTAGTIVFQLPNYAFQEDGTPFGLPVSVQRFGGMDGNVSATITMMDGTANSDPASPFEPVDYTPMTFTVAFQDQDTTPVMLSLAGVIVQDALPELDETFTLVVGNTTGGALAGNPATVTIIDDDFFVEIPNPAPGGGLFGSSVAKVGPHLLIGAPGNAAPEGRVYVFDPSIPALVDTISRPSSVELGKRLDLSGNALSIGSSGKVWVLNADTFADRTAVTSSLAGFGAAIAGLGDGRLAVGAPDEMLGGATTPGAVRVYDDLTGALLQPIDGMADQKLGASFALLGSDLVIGAPGGLGQVLQVSGTPLALTMVFVNPIAEAPSPGFGSAVAAIGSTLFVGAPDSDVGAAVDGGRVHFFSPSRMGFFELPLANARFGAVLAALGDKICIQAPGDGPLASGRVHVFDQSLQSEFTIFDDPAPTAGADFGAAMCEFDGVLVIGAPRHDAGAAVDQGSIFIFKVVF